MTDSIQLGDLVITVTRKDVKHVHLSVHPPNGRVTLVAPRATRLEVAHAYAATRLGWIRAQQERFRGQARETPRRFVEGARRSCDIAILEALAAAEAEAARFEAMDLLPGRQDTHRGMLKSAAYFEAEYQRCQLLDDLRRRLQRGDLVATARERPTGPRIEVAAEAWQYLSPHFADDTARDGLGAVVLFQVRIAEAAPAQVSLAQDAMPPAITVHADPKPVYSVSSLRAWYLLRRSSWPATEQPPSEADDLAAASQHFGVKVSRDPFRAIRHEMAPAAWKKSGPRKPPK